MNSGMKGNQDPLGESSNGLLSCLVSPSRGGGRKKNTMPFRGSPGDLSIICMKIGNPRKNLPTKLACSRHWPILLVLMIYKIN